MGIYAMTKPYPGSTIGGQISPDDNRSRHGKNVTLQFVQHLLDGIAQKRR